MQKKTILPILLACMTLSSVAQAQLYDRGNGLIYDSIKDITWLADANYAKTSGYDADGKMNWTQAKSWAANLNYAGFDDWRLPTTSPAVTGVNDKYGQTSSEMGHLFFSDFGAKVVKTPYTRTTPEIYTTTFLNPDKVALFTNLQEYAYWSDTSFASATGLITGAWYFNTNTGIQGVVRKPLQTWNYALAVRSGDVFYTQASASAKLADTLAVPENQTWSMLLAGIGVLAATARRRQNLS